MPGSDLDAFMDQPFLAAIDQQGGQGRLAREPQPAFQADEIVPVEVWPDLISTGRNRPPASMITSTSLPLLSRQ